MDMAADFNMNTFLNEQSSYLNRNYTNVENGKAAMEAADIQRAKEAVEAEEGSFLSLTLGEKLKELGVGEHVLNQLKETALNTVTGVFTPLSDYLKKYENIFDQNVYNAELQANGKQMFFTRMALAQESEQDEKGQKFVYDM